MTELTIIQFALATILPTIATVGLIKFRQVRQWKASEGAWQVLCGVVFGTIAILGTEFGIITHDATMNVRDAAPIAAGFFFGGPAGIIAGLMGGIERWFAALWGRGMFTRVACSIATCTSGLYAWFLRKYVFEERKPSWPLACTAGIVAEVLHLLLVFLTNIGRATQAFIIVRACTFPMVCCTGIAVGLAAAGAAWASGEWNRKEFEAPNISQVMQSRLLGVVMLGFITSAIFTLLVQGSIAVSETSKLLTLALSDAQNDIYRASDNNLLDLTRRAAIDIQSVESATQEAIDKLMGELDVSEIHVINQNGIIVLSSDPKYVGFNMASGKQSSEFLKLLPGGGASQLVQAYQPSTYDKEVWRKYAGVRIGGGFLQVGYDDTHFLDDLSERVSAAVRNRHVGQDGALVVIAPDNTLAGTRAGFSPSDSDMKKMVIAVHEHQERTVFTLDLEKKSYYASFRYVEGFKVFALVSKSNAERGRDVSVLVTGYMEVIVFASLFVAVFLLIRNEVVRNIWRVNGTLDKITHGDLHAQVSVNNNAEFISLSRDINTMVASLRDAIAAESARIDRELDYARAIQESALPRTFPPFPEIASFDIYAQMQAAREVGGDFYDFFLVDDHTLGLLVADVSGKGIPASLFMMAAKTELSNYMNSGMPLAEAVQTANWHLCQGNEAGMFVTVWAAELNYRTGELTYVNAGHNPPLLRHNGTWRWLTERGGLFLGSFETARYRSRTITLSKGDQLFLYTDGVNEAFSAQGEQYGNDRLEQFLTSHAVLHPRPLIDAMHAELMWWEEGAEQSDDITMLSMEYGVGPQATGSLTVPATLDQLDTVLDYVHNALHDRNCPISTQKQLDIVIEELFVNVCNYAYRDSGKVGDLTLEYVYNASPSAITISLTDSGKAFDPLEHTDPRKPTSIADAKIGGLGIMMVKRMTDDLSYVRHNGTNTVAFVKSW